ncbi:phosphoglycerate mutase family protein [Dendryphion nanum]|uniref:Phosphoglycerate mutase family protein n=1 Tax=Dendryphion nanum TaxID=256645 RepID=A0A9P9DIM9_9PLEO|nr:phosphoglycerate mutase family protein [Dendryphion nanum]
MPPTLFLVRHAQGHHNIPLPSSSSPYHAVHIRDALLTPYGKSQCGELSARFPYHQEIDLIVSSPLRRTIQTVAWSFGPVLRKEKVQWLLEPKAQEVSRLPCDVGHGVEELRGLVGEEGVLPVGVGVERMGWGEVAEGWNSKTGYWAAEPEAVRRRAADFRAWLFGREEQNIVVVTHGAFLHYLTEDWTGDDPSRGTAYLNCEVRQFKFTTGSSVKEAHLEETTESRLTRGARETEKDANVIEEIKLVEAA